MQKRERDWVVGVLNSFKSSYLNILAGYLLRQEISIVGAHMLAKKSIHDVNQNVNIKDKFIVGDLTGNIIVYNDDELNVHISFSDENISIRSFNKKTDKVFIDIPVDYQRAEKILKKIESSSSSLKESKQQAAVSL